MKKVLKYIGVILAIALIAATLGIVASAQSTVHYIDENGVSQLRSDVEELTGTLSVVTLESGWYIITGNTTAYFQIKGDVHIILADGASCDSDIHVTFGNSISIYAQQQGTGELIGTIGATRDDNALGCGNITINGGIITANAGKHTAGIGGALDMPENVIGNITINGGTVTATTESDHLPGIGAKYSNPDSSITINGGTIVAKGGIYPASNRSYSAGIGFCYGSVKSITINGGTIDAQGDAIGIGADLTPIIINGGRIKAKAQYGVGIGGAEESSGEITINGGYVEAISTYGSAIGVQPGKSPEYPININGGTVVATAPDIALGSDGSYYKGDSPYDLVITGGSIITSPRDYDDHTVTKNKDGEVDFTARELTLEDSGNGTKLSGIVGIDYGIKDVETVDGKVKIYYSNADLPTKIYTDKGIYLPTAEGALTYELHTAHTVAPTYTPNALDSEQHDKHYACCDELTVEEHLFEDGKHTCDCGLDATALVDGVYFVSFDKALAFAESDEESTVKLLSNAEIVDDINLSGNITLDLGGFGLVTSEKYMYAIYLRSGSLTLTDSSADKSGSIIANSLGINTIGAESGKLTVLDGSYGKIAVTAGEVTVKGGNIEALNLTGGTLKIEGGEFGSITSHTDIQPALAENLFLYDEDGAIVDGRVKELQSVKTKLGADLVNSEATLEYNETPYTSLAKEPTVSLSIFGSPVSGENYDIEYSYNTLPGEATVTVRGKGSYSGEKAFTFTVTKGTLKVLENPNATHEFGDIYSDKAITGGKVVIVGYEDAVISGSWSWVEGEPKATFTPDESYDGLFLVLEESYEVNITVTAAKPVLNIEAPSPSLIPGVDTVITVNAKNPYNGELTDLPTDYKIIYKIGEDGEEVTVEGLTLRLPDTAKMGDTVYLRVENLAIDSKYSVATSENTLALTVGQIDYSKDIEEVNKELSAAIEELKEAVQNENTQTGEITEKITALQDRIKAAEDILSTPTDNVTESEMQSLKAALEAADTELDGVIKEMGESLTATKNDLTSTKNDLEDTKSALEDTKSDLEDTMSELEAAKSALAEANNNLNTTSSALETTKQNLEATKLDLKNTKTQLESRIDAIDAKESPVSSEAIVAIVIASVSIAANLALGVFTFIIKRKIF